MDIILIFLGILTGLALFLYLFSKYHDIVDKKKYEIEDIEIKTDEKQDLKEEEAQPKKEEKMRKRFCPLCGAELGPNDSLYAEMYEGNPRPKVIIHGCRYCHTPGKKIEQEKILNNTGEKL